MNGSRGCCFVLIVWASGGRSDWDFLLSTVLICIVDSVAFFIVIHILLCVFVVLLNTASLDVHSDGWFGTDNPIERILRVLHFFWWLYEAPNRHKSCGRLPFFSLAASTILDTNRFFEFLLTIFVVGATRGGHANKCILILYVIVTSSTLSSRIIFHWATLGSRDCQVLDDNVVGGEASSILHHATASIVERGGAATLWLLMDSFLLSCDRSKFLMLLLIVMMVHVTDEGGSVLERLREVVDNWNLAARLDHRAEDAVAFRALAEVEGVSEKARALLCKAAGKDTQSLFIWGKISNVHPWLCNDLSDRSLLIYEWLLLIFETNKSSWLCIVPILIDRFDDDGLPALRFLQSRFLRGSPLVEVSLQFGAEIDLSLV